MAKKSKSVSDPYVRTKRDGDGWTSQIVCPSRILGKLKVIFGDTIMEKVHSRDGSIFESLHGPTKADWITMTGEVKNIEIKEWK